MAFDDYSYKFYNNVVLNPKTVKAINDDENTSLIAATNIKGSLIKDGEEDSVLTNDNVKEFEKNMHKDIDYEHTELTIANF